MFLNERADILASRGQSLKGDWCKVIMWTEHECDRFQTGIAKVTGMTTGILKQAERLRHDPLRLARSLVVMSVSVRSFLLRASDCEDLS
eukprot:4274824-Alexandrium_andersonii.AAC.1